MELYFTGESIECDKCHIITRNPVIGSAIIHPTLGRLLKYECSRNSTAEILKELTPKETKYKITSKLDLHTILKADSIFFLTKKLRPIKWNLINKSGRHKANEAIIDEYTFAEIKYPLENVLNAMAKRKEIT